MKPFLHIFHMSAMAFEKFFVLYLQTFCPHKYKMSSVSLNTLVLILAFSTAIFYFTSYSPFIFCYLSDTLPSR